MAAVLMAATTWLSSGGVRLTIPPDWQELASDEDVGHWVRPAGGTMFTPVLQISVIPTVLDRAAWSVLALRPVAGQLLEFRETADGFEGRHLWVAADRLVETRSRLVQLPGRSLHVMLTTSALDGPRFRDEVATVLNSVSVEGVGHVAV